MTKIKTVLLALVVVAAFGAISVANASALEWLLNNAAITSAKAVTSSGTLVLSDMEATGGESKIECSGTDKGTVGPGAADTVTEITASGCKRLAGLCENETITAKAVHLPWKTELVDGLTGEIRDNITGTGGSPGWTVECKALGGLFKAVDTCEGNTSTSMKNEGENVAATFDAMTNEAPATCSISKKASGLVTGTDVNHSSEGTLSVM